MSDDYIVSFIEDDMTAHIVEDNMNVFVTDDYNTINFPQPITERVASDLSKKIIVKAVAGEDIESFRVVYFKEDKKIYKASSDNEDILKSKLGIVLISLSEGQEADVVLLGGVENLDWNLFPTSYFLSLDGLITNLRPTTGISVKLGTGFNEHMLIFDPEQPIKLL